MEEVFAAVGESVSLSCSSISSLGVSAMWTVSGRLLTDNSSHDKGQSDAFHVNQDSSLAISKVSALHGGDYQCSDSNNHQVVLNKIRLHILDGENLTLKSLLELELWVTAIKIFPLVFVFSVTSEYAPGGDTLTLTCALICSKECENDFNLTWKSGSSHKSWQSGLMNINNTLINKLYLPVHSMRSDEITCSVLREDAVMTSKKWCYNNCEFAP